MNPFQFQGRPPAPSSPQGEQPQRFVHLAPTGDADETGVYREALTYATSCEEVLNIALTGPYGSGKSSVIKSFLGSYEGKPLQLSLASFLPDGEAGVNVTKQEIERSILQQLLYGADADNLPLSRFKRIQTPSKWSRWDSLFVAVGMVCAYYIFSSQSDVVSGKFFKPYQWSNWFNYLSFVVTLLFSWRVVHSVHVKSLGLSLKSISLKDVQIAPDAANTESILNRHLDEIIYFFQSTNYDLVVIEDLDRFNDPEIFVTLREINGLINSNAGVNRRIRFLYALRDDIFVNTDRTKFFEFIVPVIPVINHSNSIDKVLEHGHRINLDDRLNRQFIRDVSRYLNDLRLISNIFNEYVVYSRNLEAEDGPTLNPDKLLAILIYKNVIPKDFAALHRQEGALSKVLSRYDSYITEIEQRLRGELASIEEQVGIGEAQALRDHSELRKVYAMGFVERIPPPFTIISANGRSIAFSQLAGEEEIEIALSLRGNTLVSSTQGHQQRIVLDGVESSVDPRKTFSERKAEIESKSLSFKETCEKRSRLLKREIASLRTRKFNEVVRENAQLIDDVFSEVGESRDLLKFLILEGYLDDTYYQYVSLFHSGRLSPNDNKFLFEIRSYSNPHPDFQLDNVLEVIASMRVEDFGQRYVLNRHIVDCLLDDTVKNAERLSDACRFLSTHFSECADFFLSYYVSGMHVDRLIFVLLRQWVVMPAIALAGKQSTSHAARLLAYAPEESLRTPSFLKLSQFISGETASVLGEGVEFEIGRLKLLGVQVADLPSIARYDVVVQFVAAQGLYRLNVANIRHVMENIVGWSDGPDLETRNYSALLEANDEALMRRINADFVTYLSEVLLALDGNTEEDVSAILKVLNHEDVEQALREDFLRKQSATLTSFSGVPAIFHPLLLEKRMVQSTWENCLAFLSSEAYTPELLTSYLEDSAVNVSLARLAIPDSDEARPIRTFLIENDALAIDVYSSYIRQLPRPFQLFPSLEEQKIRVLIEERKVVFSVKSFEQLANVNLRVTFLAMNVEAYWAKPDGFEIDDDFRKMLLNSTITDSQKLKIIQSMDPAFVSSNPLAAAIIGPIIDRLDTDISNYGAEFIEAVILASKPIAVQISLLNRAHRSLSDSGVRNILGGLPEPYRDIAVYGRSPRIESNDGNELLASWLKERGLISSFTTSVFGGGIRVNTFRKKQ